MQVFVAPEAALRRDVTRGRIVGIHDGDEQRKLSGRLSAGVSPCAPRLPLGVRAESRHARHGGIDRNLPFDTSFVTAAAILRTHGKIAGKGEGIAISRTRSVYAHHPHVETV